MAAASHRDADPSAARRLIEQVVKMHFGERPKRMRKQGGGLTNSVWRVRVADRDYVVRTHDDVTKAEDYRKEHWAMDAARASGVPTPQVLEVGNVDDGRPYMIVEYVEGIDGSKAERPLRVLEAMGSLARRLHGVKTSGFGRSFDWSRNRLSRHDAWRDWIVEGFDVEHRIELLARRRVIDAAQAHRLQALATTVSHWAKSPALQHGDLRLKNVLLDDDGHIVALIDWENAVSAPPPYWDLAIALHDLGVDEKEAFLTGYGLTPRAYEAALPSIRFFNVLNYAQQVDGAAKRHDRACLARIRLRLAGALDLYAV